MLFDFLKYINPGWYFNLAPPSQAVPYFVDCRKLDKTELDLLNIDEGYNSIEGKLADAAYQAWHKGFIKRDPGFSLFTTSPIKSTSKQREIELFEGHTVKVVEEVYVKAVCDNYRFIRRFFNPAIGWYILFVRLLSFHNPVKELYGFIKTLQIRRVDLYRSNSWVILKDDFAAFDSSLIKIQPKVSVVIPTLNRYSYLKDVLSDLEEQDYRNFEVIACDQSDKFDKDFYNGWNLDLKLIRQEEKALWLARNTAVRAANGEYIAFSEDDVRIDPDWLKQHLKCIDYFKADISAGVFFPEGSEMPVHKRFFKWAEQFATGNAMLKKDVFSRTGLFDRHFEKQRGGDGEFGLRCYLLGFTGISNPLAFCKDVKAPTGGLREQGSWDSLRPTRLFAPRPVPSVLYLSRKYFGNHLSLLMLLFSVPGSVIPYSLKSNRVLKVLASMSFVVTWPFILMQVIISWRDAGRKLNQGAKIELLN